MKTVRYLSLIFVFIIIVTSVYGVRAQSDYRFKIVQVDDADFPLIDVYVSVLDPLGQPIDELTNENYSLLEDNKLIIDFELTRRVNLKQALSVLILVDRSQSMSPDLENSVEAIKSFLPSLIDNDQVALVSFAEDIKLLQELDTDKTKVPILLEDIVAEGNTALYDGLLDSIDILKDKSEPRVILIITNGVESGISQATFDDVVKSANENVVQVFPVGVGQLVYGDQLDALALRTGGKAFILPGEKEQSEELKDAFINVLSGFENLRTQYVLSYRSALNSNGSEYEVKVKANYQGWEGENTQQFIACPGDVKVCLPDVKPAKVVGSNICLEPLTYTSNPPIQRLTVLMDNQLICSDSSMPFTCCLNPQNVSEGTHQFDFSIQDSADQSGQLSSSLFVRPPVKISIEEPNNDARVSSSMRVSAGVDSLLKIDTIYLKADGDVLETLDGSITPMAGPPYVYDYDVDLDISKVRPGNRTFSVEAVDESGFSKQEQVNLTVINPMEVGGGIDPIWFFVVVIAIAAVLIPLGLRSRRGNRRGAGSQSGGQAVLRELQGLYPNQSWPLTGAEIRMGRKAEENDITLKGLSASRSMAVIRSHQGRHYIYSLNPQNPVIVNNAPVQQHMLEPRDVIRAGESVFEYAVGG